MDSWDLLKNACFAENFAIKRFRDQTNQKSIGSVDRDAVSVTPCEETDLQNGEQSGCSPGCRDSGQRVAVRDAAMQKSESASLSKAKTAPVTNDDIAARFEAKLMAAARECRTIVQRCLREEEWLDADESFAAVLRRHFG